MALRGFRPCHHCGGNVAKHVDSSCIPADAPPSSWQTWSDAITSGVRGVPDETLRRVAEIIAGARVVLTAGNGGSASLASHAAQAIMKPDYKAGGGAPALCLNDMVPTHTAHANDGGWETALLEAARPFLDSGAILLLISSSGKSPNIVKLATEARQRWHGVVAFTGFDGGPLRSLATASVHVDSRDYEVVEPVHDALLHRVQYHLRELNKK